MNKKIGIGTAALGRPQYINVRLEDCDNSDVSAFRAQSFSVLEEAYKAGIRYFDTAPGYGLAEELLLEWLQTKNDNSIQVATKWGYTYTANFDANAKVHEVKEHSLQKLNEQWHFSKQLLPYLKVYQIHSATLDTGVLENSEVLKQLAFLKKEYNLKIGITTSGSNQVEIIKKALEVLVDESPIFDVFQVTYNFLDQSFLAIANELIRQKKSIVIKEALANGRVFPNTNYQNYTAMYGKLKDLTLKYNVGVDAIALQFCLQSIPNATVLSGASSTKQLHQNLKASSLLLSDEDMKTLQSFNISPEFYWSERKQLQWN